MEAPESGTAPSASDASQSAASSAESTPSPAETAAPASDPSSDSSALASTFGVVDDGGVPPVGPARDAQGRFAAKPAEAQSEPAPDAAPAQPAAPASQKFKLADLEFDTPEHAAQQIKTLRGMFKPMEREVRDLRSELTNAINVANAWKAQAEGRAAQPPADPAKPPAAAPASDAPVEPKWDVIDHLARHPEAGVAGALIEYHTQAQALAEAREKQLVERLTKEIEGRYAPVLASHAEQAELAEVDALVRGMADWTMEATGQPAFPELRDIHQIAAIGQTWRDAGNDPKALKTPQGIQMAVALHRMWSGFSPAPVAPAAPSTQAPAAPAAPAPPGSADLALAMSGSAPPSVRPAGSVTPQQAARAAIRGADPMDAFFGVTP
jgi:hypothetical protein